MNTKTSATIAGILALVIAGSILAVSTYTGNTILPTQNTSVTSYSGSTSTGTASPPATTQSSSSAASGAAAGTLSVLLTDPPNVPDGVTKLYITYSNLAVHVSGAGNDSGWAQIKAQGTIELIGTVNVSQTLSSVKITSGDYNLLRFNISSALVTYNGKNFTAFVQDGRLLVPIVGGIEVNDSKPSATIIEIHPSVFNIGDATNPEFIIRPVAKALPVPSGEVNEQMKHEGFRMDLKGKAWWRNLEQRFTANAQITTAALTAKSLAVTVKNTGNETTVLRLVMVSPLSSALKGERGGHMPSAFFDSAVYLVLKNGTLVPLTNFVKSMTSSGSDQKAHKDTHELMQQIFKATGFNVTAGSTASLTYSGQVTFGLQLLKKVSTSSVVTGQQYLVTVLGEESLASMVVVAG